MIRLSEAFARHRGVIAVFIFLMTALSAYGLARLSFDDSYTAIFKSDSPSFRILERLSSDFQLDTNDFVVIADSKDILSRESIHILREMDFEFREIDSVQSVYSIFTARSTERVNGYFPPLFPDDSAGPARFGRARAAALAHPVLKGVLLSEDGTTALFIVTLRGKELTVSEIEPAYRRLQETSRRITRATSVRARVSGIPALRAEILRNIQRDQIVFFFVGALLGSLVSYPFFRRWTAIPVATAGPVLGIIWSLGMLGLVGEKINVINSVLPPLILVIGLTDSVHLMSHFRKARVSGLSRVIASQSAIRHVGGACGLTSLTTGIAFASLAAAQTDLIQRFGLACAMSTALTFIAVITVVPLLTSTRLGDFIVSSEAPPPTSSFSGKFTGMIRNRYRLLTALAFVITLATIAVSLRLQPDYRYREYLPEANEASRALGFMNEKFGGAMPVRILVQRPETKRIISPETLGILHKIHDIVEREPLTHSPFSLLTLIRAHPTPDASEDGGTRLDGIPDELMSRLVNLKKNSALVSA